MFQIIERAHGIKLVVSDGVGVGMIYRAIDGGFWSETINPNAPETEKREYSDNYQDAVNWFHNI